MSLSEFVKPDLFEALIKSVQYIVRVKSQQDIWDHLSKFILKYFPADWVAFAQLNTKEKIFLHHCTLARSVASRYLTTKKVRAITQDVLGSGFFVSHIIRTPAPYTTLFIPVTGKNLSREVIMIGHKTTTPLPKELLNIYLAVVGLAATTMERLQNEFELNKHKANLEELVRERTAKLRESENKYRVIAENTYDFEFWIGPDGRYLYVSPSCKRVTGYSPKDFMKDPKLRFKIVYPEDMPLFKHHVNEAEKRKAGEVEFRIICKNGSLCWMSHACQPVYDEQGVFLGTRGANRDITARKEAEEKILKDRQLLDSLINSLPGVFYALDASGKFLLTNDKFSEITGYSAQELLKMQATKLFAGEEKKLIEERIKEVFEKGESFAEAHFISKDGKKKAPYYFTGLRTLKDDSPILIGMGIDISERREMEDALKKSRDELEKRVQERTKELNAERQRFNDVLNMLPAYVVLLTPDYHVPFANRFFEERFGKSYGKCCYDYLFHRTEPCENCETYKVLKTNAPHHWEWTGPDNRNYDIYDFPFTDADGSPLIMEMGIDITEQKRAQNAVRQANAYNRNLLEVSLDPLVTISPEGKITDVNMATTKVTGFSRDMLIGTDFSTYFTEPEKAQAGYRLVFSQGTIKDYPLTIRHKNGKLTDVLYNASVYKDEAGNILGVFAAARDVTLQKQAEAELRRHRDNLEALVKERTSELEAVNAELLRSNENLGQFAYVASHDLQEPLRVMASYSQLLERRYKDKLDADANDFIGFIVDAASRMQKLITDLLSYSRAASKDVRMTHVDCNEVLRKVIASLSATVKSIKAKIIVDNLPKIFAHETGLIQVFQNLLGNALKFRRKEPPAIHITAGREKTEWVFSVQDNGIGIEPQYKERIFQIFQRLHSKHEYSGTGIGLSICKKIVENSGGRIWVESEPEKGSTFYFTIPVK